MMKTNLFNQKSYMKGKDGIDFKTQKFPLAAKTQGWLNIFSELKCNYYHEYLACEYKDFFRTIQLSSRELRSRVSGEQLPF